MVGSVLAVLIVQVLLPDRHLVRQLTEFIC
jgi:hypothetical protein